VPEALHRLVEAYTILGLKDEATRIASVLGYNYPGSKWYADSYTLLDPAQRARLKDERGWVDRTVESILKPE
jgi:outer membrane protein assembly factor BamD